MAPKEKFYDEVEEILNALLARKDRPPKKKKHFSASGAGGCQRAQILDRLGASKVTPLTAKQRTVFWVGEALHENLMNLLSQSGRVIEMEQYVSPYGSEIVGRIDFLWKDDHGNTVLYDLKTTRTGVFWSKIARSLDPPKNNVYQMITYYIINKKYRIDTLKLLYLSKEDGSMKSFSIPITDQLVDEVKTWWEETTSYLTKQELPVIQPTEALKKQYYCGYCKYSQHYCFPTDVIPQSLLDANISELTWDGVLNEK